MASRYNLYNLRTPRGATWGYSCGLYQDLRFNPRTSTGGDKVADAIEQGALPVSIHAPARGATLMRC